MKRALVLAILVVMGLVVSSNAAQAHTTKYKVTFTKTTRTFVLGVGYRYEGQIKSSDPACVKKQTSRCSSVPWGNTT